MSITLSLSTLAVRHLVDGACAALGVKASGEAVAHFLLERFTDHSQRLTTAIQNANDKAWKALEISLAGDSFWDRCKVFVARSEDKAFGEQVRAFLDAAPMPALAGKAAFRQKCLGELRTAYKSGALTKDTINHRQLAQKAANFARFSDPTSLLEAEWQIIGTMAEQLLHAGYTSLSWLLAQRPQRGMPILVIGARYFFRRAIEEDQKLFQGLAFAKLEALGEAQERGFAALSEVFAQQAQRLEELLGDVKTVVIQTHNAVLDLQGQMKDQSEQVQQIGQAVMKLLDQHQLQRRELRPADSMSIRNETERKFVKRLVERYRALPENERQRLPALLNAVGKLEVVTGDFDAAQRDFQQVATLVTDSAVQAEAYFNAYRTALERRDWATALRELLSAVKLDAKRFAPFPVGKYQPQRILGAGGFGVAFSCRHKELKADVVIKTLIGDDLERNVDEVFAEARVLYQLDHPAIIRLLDCGYTIPAEQARPFFVMTFFDGVTLEEYVQKHGPLMSDDLIAVAAQMAEGLQAAHVKNILHRDVKPANVLVRRDVHGWQVKLIDFGLALKHHVIDEAATTAKQKCTLADSTIAGTLDYAAPEQMGRSPGVPVGRYSDIYGWAKTCCYALFKTTQPLPKHWQSAPEPLAHLLAKCLEDDPKNRPAKFAEILSAIGARNGGNEQASAPRKNKDPRDCLKIAPSRGKSTPNQRTRFWFWPLLAGATLAALIVAIVTGLAAFRAMMKPAQVETNQGEELTKVSNVKKYPPTTTAYFRFEEGSGNMLVNSVTGGVEGTHNASYTAETAIKRIQFTGEDNKFSLVFRGSEVATIRSIFPFHRESGDATLEFWLKVAEPSDCGSLIWSSPVQDDTNRFQMHVHDGGLWIDYRTPKNALHAMVEGQIKITPHVWTHIAITRSGLVYRFYQNGSLIHTGTDVDPQLPTTGAWTIGGRASSRFKGQIDEIRCSSKALAPGEFLNAAPTKS